MRKLGLYSASANWCSAQLGTRMSASQKSVSIDRQQSGNKTQENIYTKCSGHSHCLPPFFKKDKDTSTLF